MRNDFNKVARIACIANATIHDRKPQYTWVFEEIKKPKRNIPVIRIDSKGNKKPFPSLRAAAKGSKICVRTLQRNAKLGMRIKGYKFEYQ